MIKSLFSVFALLLFQVCLGQEIDKKAIKLVEKSDDAVAERNFTKAQELLYSSLERDSSYSKSYEKLFTILRILQKPEEIHKLQLRYVQNVHERLLNNQIWQSLASFEFSHGNYLKASEFISKAKKQDSVLSESIKFAIEQSSNPKPFMVEELPEQVNKLTFQYLPVLTIDAQTLIFTGLPNSDSDEDIFISQMENGKWSEATSISENINSPFNEGACSISADGRTLILTACEGRKGYGNCDLYISRKEGLNWSVPENLGGQINSRSWDSQPSLSSDGKTLFFSSNRPGGRGGRDIWVSFFSDSGWSIPTNLGNKINTRQDETTPFIYSNGEILFFSSKGHIGMGGFDLFKAEKVNEKWQKTENLGAPINTANDEVSLFITSSGEQAFFTKEERKNGEIQNGKIVRYDIPNDEQIVAKVSYIKGKVFDQETGKPLAASIELIDLLNRKRNYITDSDPATGRFFFVLPSSEEFGLFAEMEGYLPFDISLNTFDHSTTDTLDIGLSPIKPGAKIVLNNIYFDFDSDQINAQSHEEINRIAKFLKAHINVKIEISGHTDNVGVRSYNQDLSERRARQVFLQLTLLGLSPDQIDFVGYGDRHPISSNETERKRQRNRRIEFKILSLTE